MGQKSHPTSLRLEHTNRSFDMEWHSHHFYKELLAKGIEASRHLNGVLRNIRYPNGRLFLQGGGNRERVYLFFYNSNSKGLKEIRKKKFRLRPRKVKGLKGRIQRLREKQELMMEKIRKGELSPRKWGYIPHVPTFVHKQIINRCKARREKIKGLRYPFVEMGLNFPSKGEVYETTSFHKEPRVLDKAKEKSCSAQPSYTLERVGLCTPVDTLERRDKEKDAKPSPFVEKGLFSFYKTKEKTSITNPFTLQLDSKFALSFNRQREASSLNPKDRRYKGLLVKYGRDSETKGVNPFSPFNFSKERLPFKDVEFRKRESISSLYVPSLFKRVIFSLLQPIESEKGKTETKRRPLPAFTSSWLLRTNKRRSSQIQPGIGSLTPLLPSQKRGVLPQRRKRRVSFLETDSRLRDFQRRYLLIYNTSIPIPLKRGYNLPTSSTLSSSSLSEGGELKRRFKGGGFWNPPFIQKPTLPLLNIDSRVERKKEVLLGSTPMERNLPTSREDRREGPTFRERMTVRSIRASRRLKGGVRSILASASPSSSRKIREVRRMSLYYPLFMSNRSWPKTKRNRNPLSSLSEISFSNPLYTLFLKKAYGCLEHPEPGLLGIKRKNKERKNLQSSPFFERRNSDSGYISNPSFTETPLSNLPFPTLSFLLKKGDELMGSKEKNFLSSQGLFPLSSKPKKKKVLHLGRRYHLLMEGLKRKITLLSMPKRLKERALGGFVSLRLGLRRKGVLPLPFYQGFLEQALSLHANHPVFFQSFRVPRETQSSQFLAESLASLLERRVPWLKLKYHILREIGRNKKIEGIRVSFSGRLGGRSKKAQRSRTQTFLSGSTSLHIFSGKIDFYSTAARTSFGLLGVKVWVSYKTKKF